MCGIAGAIQKGLTKDKWERILLKMANSLRHRGPDDYGLWLDETAGIGVAHTRLSILDLSKEGHQPMISHSMRYVISYNGEVYNYPELKEDLGAECVPWRGNSDTEVILSAIDAWGINNAVTKFNGMFAFAVWDKKERTLSLCRDRLGIKPLYYAKTQHGVIWGSELKAIKSYPGFIPEIDRNSLALYLRHNCIPAPYTIYKNTWKLAPGHILQIEADECKRDFLDFKLYCYWNAPEIVSSNQKNRSECYDKSAVLQLETLLRDSIKKRMITDVPIGTFLSGGIDSSTVTALMQALSDRPVKTFSIGTGNKDYNEAAYAKEVANFLKTDHTEFYVNSAEVIETIPQIPTLYDEPFSDSSQIPTFIVSNLAREHVTVCLSGDGGDELFGGYNRHYWVPYIWKRMGWVPYPLRKTVASLLQSIPFKKWDGVFQQVNRVLPASKKINRATDNLQKMLEIMPLDSSDLIYRQLCSHWKNPASVIKNGVEYPSLITDCPREFEGLDISHKMMGLDLITYLPDDILVKVDRASMGCGLEARVPLLDHRVVEYAWKLPLSMKIRKKESKWILRQVLYKYIPKRLVERPKSGFALPIDDWLRNQLRDWAEELIRKDRIQNEGFFHTGDIRKKWGEHMSGKKNWQYLLWDILMFQAWLECQKKTI